VVGSYERGDRAISAQRLTELAEFYGVPVVEILPEEAASAVDDREPRGVALDLVKLVEDTAPEVKPIQRWISLVQKQRGDFNRKMLTIRGEDVRLLAAACDTTPAELVELLAARGILSKSV
jgi:transcriptional regulator with XRE-family HTH domain